MFDVFVNGEKVLRGIDIAARTGGAFRGMAESFAADAGTAVTVELRKTGEAAFAPLLSGVEFVAIGSESAATGL